MAKGGKAAPWKGVARGVLAALALYLCGTALLALLMVKGAVPERAGFPVLMVLCVASALCGGLLAGVLAGSRRGRSKKGKRVNHASRFK